MNKQKINNSLEEKIENSKKVLKEAYEKYGKGMAISWTGGKDSTTLVHIARNIFGSKNKLPIIYLDTQLDFEEIYSFIDKVSKKWSLNLFTIKTTKEQMEKYNSLKIKADRSKLATYFKINLLKKAIKKYKITALVSAIRWDEQPERVAEKYFSPRKDHMRIHPLLHFIFLR